MNFEFFIWATISMMVHAGYQGDTVISYGAVPKEETSGLSTGISAGAPTNSYYSFAIPKAANSAPEVKLFTPAPPKFAFVAGPSPSYTSENPKVSYSVTDMPSSASSTPKKSTESTPVEVPKISYSFTPVTTYASPVSRVYSAAPAVTYSDYAPKFSVASVVPKFRYSYSGQPTVSYSDSAPLPPVYAKIAPNPAIAVTQTVPYASPLHKISYPFSPVLSYAAASPGISYSAAPPPYIITGAKRPSTPTIFYKIAQPKVVDEGSFESNPEYSYAYEVSDDKSGDQKSFKESRSKDGTVTGSYSVIDPDGSNRTVEYTADHINGFKAVVHQEKADSNAAPPTKPITPSSTKSDPQDATQHQFVAVVSQQPAYGSHIPVLFHH